LEKAELSFPPVEELGYGSGIHVAHVAELGGLLGVEKLAVGVEDGESGNSFFKRDVVFFGDVEIFVEAADVDVDEEKVFVEEFQVWGLMEVDVENLAVAAPVAAEVEDNAFVLEAGLLESRSDFGFGIGFGGVEVFLHCGHGGDRLACVGWRRGLAAFAPDDDCS
jgi:hypothetical protein